MRMTWTMLAAVPVTVAAKEKESSPKETSSDAIIRRPQDLPIYSSVFPQQKYVSAQHLLMKFS